MTSLTFGLWKLWKLDFNLDILNSSLWRIFFNILIIYIFPVLEGRTQATFKVHLRSNIATLRRSTKGKGFTRKCSKKFSKFTGKNLRWINLLIKLHIAAYLEKNSIRGVFLWLFRTFSELLFCGTTSQLLVKSGNSSCGCIYSGVHRQLGAWYCLNKSFFRI